MLISVVALHTSHSHDVIIHTKQLTGPKVTQCGKHKQHLTATAVRRRTAHTIAVDVV